jgi:hypothetical protein
LNLQQDTDGPYDACPYCLTEITLEDESTINFDEPETLESETLEPETFEPEETLVESEPEVEEAEHIEEPAKETAKAPETPSDCAYYLGYLSEKSSKDQIPDECMMCKDIVTCMLKKMNA